MYDDNSFIREELKEVKKLIKETADQAITRDEKWNERFDGLKDDFMDHQEKFLQTKMFMWVVGFIIIGMLSITGVGYKMMQTINTNSYDIESISEEYEKIINNYKLTKFRTTEKDKNGDVIMKWYDSDS